MCGHVGVFGRVNKASIYLFECLLNLDVERGSDSTGVAFVNRRNQVSVVKDTVLPFELLRNSAYMKQAYSGDNICLIGHNRAATVGRINVDNAHPHVQGTITLAHNGSLTDQTTLPDHKNFTNDSKNLAHSVNKIGIAETWKLTKGPATLVYWDEKDATLNFISNGFRPFCFALLKGTDLLVWSSEEQILRKAIAHTQFEIVGKGDGDVYKLTDHEHITFKFSKKGLTFSKRMLTPFSYRIVSHTNHENYEDRWKNMEPRVVGPRSSVIVHPNVVSNPAREVKQEQIPFRSNTRDKYPNEADFHAAHKQCALCQNTLEHEYGHALVIDTRSAVCSDCVATAAANQIAIDRIHV